MNAADFLANYVASLPLAHPHRHATPDAFAFGGASAAAIADELAARVLAGIKRATTSLAIEYSSVGEALPQAGDLSIVLDARGEAVALIERTAVNAIRFRDVASDYAAIEGEGDGSLDYWRRAHAEYFEGVCTSFGMTFDESTVVLGQQFRLIWPQLQLTAA